MSAELLELGSRPIRPDAPGGDPGRDEPEFETLQSEIRKLELPDQPTIDWPGVVSAASTLLGQKSKDVLVASYMTLGLLERDGMPGLVTGLTVMRDMVTNFWDTMHPEVKRMRGRVAAIEWLAERGAPRIERARNVNAEIVKQGLERVREIGDLLGPKVDGGATLLAELRRALEEAESRTARPEPRPAAAAPAGAAAGSAAVASAAPANIASEEDLDKTMAEARRLFRMVSEYLRQADPKNPHAYRLPRFATWAAVKQVPPHTGGKTQIPAPQPADLADKIKGMLSAAQWPGVLQETEGRFGNSVFWLDLHCWAARALEGMGEEYAAAAESIAEEVAALLRRFPEVADLRFVDDRPLADADTKRWIAQKVLVARGDGAAVAVPDAAAEGEEDEFEKSRSEAWKLVRKRKVTDALSLLDRGVARAGRLRDRVRWRLEIARICMEKGHTQTAVAQLEGLDQELQQSTIEEWDPELCTEVIRNLLVCRQKLTATKSTPEDATRSRELMGRLCRLDVVAALELNGKK